MFRALTKLSVRLTERYLPDPYIFVIILTLIAGFAATGIEQKNPMDIIQIWGSGFWGLLPFSMQMVLVLVTGYMLAITPLMRKLLTSLAKLAQTPIKAVILVTFVSLVASWINWGFGLVVGAIFAKEIARNVRVDYRLLIASAYSGYVIWHGGISGSIPLTIATNGHFMADKIGVIPITETVFSTFNLMIMAGLFIVIPLVNRLMMPKEEESIYIDPKLLVDPETKEVEANTPAAKMEQSLLFTILIGIAGVAYIFNYYIVQSGRINLNIVNFTFLFLSIILHGTPARLLASLEQAIKGAGGIVLQFPFYAGIMAIVTESGLALTLSSWFVSFASADSLPFWTFLSAGFVNLFVPSGGGQWAVQAPIVVESTQLLGADIARVAMAVAWGDSWTNLLQPFWALPALAIAGLKAKDIIGFCLIQLFITGILISIGLSFF